MADSQVLNGAQPSPTRAGDDDLDAEDLRALQAHLERSMAAAARGELIDADVSIAQMYAELEPLLAGRR